MTVEGQKCRKYLENFQKNYFIGHWGGGVGDDIMDVGDVSSAMSRPLSHPIFCWSFGPHNNRGSLSRCLSLRLGMMLSWVLRKTFKNLLPWVFLAPYICWTLLKFVKFKTLPKFITSETLLKFIKLFQESFSIFILFGSLIKQKDFWFGATW